MTASGWELRHWSRLRTAIAKAGRAEQGVTTIEYALLIGLAVVILLFGLGLLGNKIDDRFNKTSSEPGLGTVQPPTAPECDASYTGACVPPFPPDLDCPDLRALGLQLPVRVVGRDPHRLDPDGDGLGC